MSKDENQDVDPIDKEGRQAFLGYENQNHGHNDDNQMTDRQRSNLFLVSLDESFFEGESNFLANSS